MTGAMTECPPYWLYDPEFWDVFLRGLHPFDDAQEKRRIAAISECLDMPADRIKRQMLHYLRGYVAEVNAKVCRGSDTIN